MMKFLNKRNSKSATFNFINSFELWHLANWYGAGSKALRTLSVTSKLKKQTGKVVLINVLKVFNVILTCPSV